MIIWFWTNVMLTMLALAFARLNRLAPHRLRFLVCFMALCGWLVPWNQMGRLLPVESLVAIPFPDLVSAEFGPSAPNITVDPTAGGLMQLVFANIETILLAATIAGALMFAYSSLRYVLFVRRLSRGGVSGSHLWSQLPWETIGPKVRGKKPALRIQGHVAGAVTTGLLVPTIWVHKDLIEHPDFRAVLLHEYRHVRNYDNAYLWLITLIERLFWWNPLLYFLASRTRRLQELSCDEACANDLAGYREMLNRLILDSSRLAWQPCPQTPNIHHSKSFNVLRLRALEEKYAMKTRHYLSTGLLLLGSSITLSWAMAQDAVERSNPLGCRSVEGNTIEEVLEEIKRCTGQDLGPITGFAPGTTLEEAERLYQDMKIYAELIQRQHERQEEIIESLREEIETLQEQPQLAETR